MKNIGERIRRRRIELGWTQEELAKKVGYESRSSINKIELGVNDIPRSKISEFANILGVSTMHLMGLEQVFTKREIIHSAVEICETKDAEHAAKLLETDQWVAVHAACSADGITWVLIRTS